MDERLLSQAEICEWLGISRSTLASLRNEGLPALYVGKQIRFSLPEVKQWLESKRHIAETQKETYNVY